MKRVTRESNKGLKGAEKSADLKRSYGLLPRLLSSSWLELVLNVMGTFLFVVGSLCWVFGNVAMSAFVFVIACILMGIACAIYSHKARGQADDLGCFKAGLESFGCFLFAVASLTFVFTSVSSIGPLVVLSQICFVIASVNFLTAASMQHVLCQGLGQRSPLLFTRKRFYFYPSVCNTFGSILFTLGSIFLFWDPMELAGAWFYTVGSVGFLVAACGDVAAYNDNTSRTEETPLRHLTQNSHQNAFYN